MTAKKPAPSRQAKGKAKKPTTKKKAPTRRTKAKSTGTTAKGAPSKRGKMNGKRGRPTGYTPALGRAICKMLAMGTLSLKGICRRQQIAKRCKPSTVLGWAINPNHPFSDQYARAREIAYHAMEYEMLEIADDGTNDWMEKEGKDGETYTVPDQEVLARSRLRVDLRKWILARRLPKKFGDKVMNEHTGADGGPIQTQDVTPQATGEDHLAGLGRRYGTAKLKVIEGGKAA